MTNKLIKQWFENNNEINVQSACCFHVKKLNKKFVELECCYDKTRIKYFWDFEDLEDILLYLHMKENRNKKVSYSGHVSITLNRFDVAPKKKITKKEIDNLLSEIKKIKGGTKLYESDIALMFGVDIMNIIRKTEKES